MIKKHEKAGIRHLNNPNAFIECSDTMDEIYKKKTNCFDDMITDIMTIKKFQNIIKELFFRCRKLNISHAFITQSFFPVPKAAD